MLVHSLLVEGVDLCRLGGSTGGINFLGDGFDRRQTASGEKKPGPLARKGARDSAADRTSRSVDHRNLVVQHHLVPLFGTQVVTYAHLPARGVRAVKDADTTTSRKWASIHL